MKKNVKDFAAICFFFFALLFFIAVLSACGGETSVNNEHAVSYRTKTEAIKKCERIPDNFSKDENDITLYSPDGEPLLVCVR